MNIMGMGWEEMMIILVGALLIFGPDRLPEVAGQIGKFIRDIRKMTSDLTGEFEKTAGVGDIKKAVQNELAGVKSQVNSATKSVQTAATSVSSSATKSVTGATSAAKTTTATTLPAGSTSATKSTATTAKTSAAPKPVASKKDPWADVSFFEESLPAKDATSKPVVAVAVTSPDQTAGASTVPVTIEQVDALGRARQRRMAAGYNRRAS